MHGIEISVFMIGHAGSNQSTNTNKKHLALRDPFGTSVLPLSSGTSDSCTHTFPVGGVADLQGRSPEWPA